MTHPTFCLIALCLLAAVDAAQADPRIDVIKGKTEGITVFGTKRTSPAEPPKTPATTQAPAASAAASSAATSTAQAKPPRPAPETAEAPRPRADGAPQWGDPPSGQVPRALAVDEAKAPAVVGHSQTAATVTPTDPRLSVIRGTTDGITVLGTKKIVPTAAKGPETAASGPSVLERLRNMLHLDPPSGQTLPEVKSQAGSQSTGIPLPTATKPGGK